jgi:hypothetical protein
VSYSAAVPSSTPTRLTIDLVDGSVTVHDESDGERTHPLESPEAFRLVSDAWMRVGWDRKYVYGFTRLGRPVIQLPQT